MTNYEKIKSLRIADMAWVLCAIHDERISEANSQYKDGMPTYEKFIYAYPDLVKWLGEEFEPTDDVWSWTADDNELDRLKSDLVEATVLLKYCVNYYERPMTTAISGKLGDKVKEFIRRQEQ